MSLDFTLCHLKDKQSSSVNPPLDTKKAEGGCKVGLQACMLQTKTAYIIAGKSVSCCDNSHKSVVFATELQGCTTQ